MLRGIKSFLFFSFPPSLPYSFPFFSDRDVVIVRFGFWRDWESLFI